VAYLRLGRGPVRDLRAQLKDKGIRPYWCVHHGVTERGPTKCATLELYCLPK